MAPYAYKQLESSQHIRLLRFNISRREPESCHINLADIQFDLVSFRLDGTPEFTTLSYTWGSPHRPDTIHLSDGDLQITSTLYIALSRIVNIRWRRWDYIWVDQICIDQENLDEKNVQIPLMLSIYQKSGDLTVWLGDEQALANRLKRLTGAIDDHPFVFGPQAQHSKLTNPERLEVSRLRTFQNLISMIDFSYSEEASTSAQRTEKQENACALRQLLNLPWFCRGWVFQEIVFGGLMGGRFLLADASFGPREFFGLVYGPIEAEKLLFENRPYFGKLNDQPGSMAFDLVKQKWDEHFGMRTPSSLPAFLMKTSSSLCVTNPRDNAYAFLGFWKHHASSIKPNYLLDVADVYIQTAQALAEVSSCLDILGFCAAWDPLAGLPSWVPTWGSPPATINITGSYDTEVFCSSARYKHRHCVPENIRELSVRGKRLGVVEKVLHTFAMPQAIDPQSVREFLNLSLLVECFKTQGYCPASTDSLQYGDLRERLLNVVLAGAKRPIAQDGADGRIVVKPLPLDIRNLLRAHDQADDVFRILTPSDNEGKGKDMDAMAETEEGAVDSTDIGKLYGGLSAISRLAVVAMHRSLVVGYGGSLGLVDQRTVAGDFVCVLHGSKSPVILRAAGHGRFYVVGQCYWEGVMNGEAVSWLEKDAEEFILI